MAVDGNRQQISNPVAGVFVARPGVLADGDQDVIHFDSAHNVEVTDRPLIAMGPMTEMTGRAILAQLMKGNQMLAAIAGVLPPDDPSTTDGGL